MVTSLLKFLYKEVEDVKIVADCLVPTMESQDDQKLKKSNKL